MAASRGTMLMVGLVVGGFVGVVAAPFLDRADAPAAPGSPGAVGLPSTPSSSPQPTGSPEEFATVRRQLDETRRTLGETRVERDALRERVAALETAASLAPAAGGTAAPLSRDDVLRRIADLKPRIEDAISRHAGPEALRMIEEMIALGRDAYPEVIPLILRIDDDMDGPNTLGISMHDFYPAVGDRDLYLYAIGDATVDTRFREFAVWGLPWVAGGQGAMEAYLARLPNETDEEVLEAIASSMAHIPGGDEKGRALVQALDRTSDPRLQRRLVRGLMGVDDDASLARLQSLATAADADLAREARMALTYRSPPVPGFVTTRVFRNSQAAAAGMERGDILVAYNGVPLDSADALDRAKQTVPAGAPTRVTIYRDGAYLDLQVEGADTIGIDGAFRQPR